MTAIHETLEIDSTFELSDQAQLQIITARDLLVGSFALSSPEDAPITGRTVGCVLETDAGDLLVGRNREVVDPVAFHHAETNAYSLVAKSVGETAIRNVYMSGFDPATTGQQLKNITPCSDCYAFLDPHLMPEANIVLFKPNTLDTATVLSPDEFRPAYGTWPYSEITATEPSEVLDELAEKTPLTEQDRKVVSDLRTFGLEMGIEFYLTGSSSGRGWVSTVLHERLGTQYGDMDIIAVAKDEDIAHVRERVAAAVQAHYGTIDVQNVDADYWVVTGKNRGTQRHVTYDSLFVDGKKVMDLSWASDLEAGMLRDDYYVNNCYHKIS
jgi:cytidine deaminase